MAKHQFPWYRVIVFAVLIAALGVWIHLRDIRVVEEDPAIGSGIRTPVAAAAPMVIFDILPHAVPDGGVPMFWLRVGNVAYDIQVPGPDTDPELQRQAREMRETVFEALGEELSDLRREAPDPDVIVGEVRRGKSVPSFLYMEAFELFVKAGYGKVNVALSEASPPGRPPR